MLAELGQRLGGLPQLLAPLARRATPGDELEQEFVKQCVQLIGGFAAHETVDEIVVLVKRIQHALRMLVAAQARCEAAGDTGEKCGAKQEIARFGGKGVMENAGKVVEKRLRRWRKDGRTGRGCSGSLTQQQNQSRHPPVGSLV